MAPSSIYSFDDRAKAHFYVSDDHLTRPHDEQVLAVAMAVAADSPLKSYWASRYALVLPTYVLWTEPAGEPLSPGDVFSLSEADRRGVRAATSATPYEPNIIVATVRSTSERNDTRTRIYVRGRIDDLCLRRCQDEWENVPVRSLAAVAGATRQDRWTRLFTERPVLFANPIKEAVGWGDEPCPPEWSEPLVLAKTDVAAAARHEALDNPFVQMALIVFARTLSPARCDRLLVGLRKLDTQRLMGLPEDDLRGVAFDLGMDPTGAKATDPKTLAKVAHKWRLLTLKMAANNGGDHIAAALEQLGDTAEAVALLGPA